MIAFKKYYVDLATLPTVFQADAENRDAKCVVFRNKKNKDVRLLN